MDSMKDCTICHKKQGMKLPPRVIEIANEVAPALFFRKNIPASIGDESVISPDSGDYRNVLLYYEINRHAYLIDSAGIATPISVEVYDMDAIIEDLDNLGIEVKDIDSRLEALNDYAVEEIKNLRDNDANLQKEIEEEVDNRQTGDDELQKQIDAIESKSDVVDVVDTYAQLESYATASLGDNDVVKVLQDEEHDGAISYYRWNKTAGTWSYIGSIGPYYTKAEADEKIEGDIPVKAKNLPATVLYDGSATTHTATQVNINIKSWNLEGNYQGPLQALTIVAADSTQAGVMSVADKVALDKVVADVGNINTVLETLISGTGAK